MFEQAHKVPLQALLKPAEDDPKSTKKMLSQLCNSLNSHLNVETAQELLDYEFETKSGSAYATHKPTGKRERLKSVGGKGIEVLVERLAPYQPQPACAK